ncbi:hypothetical protein CLOM_g13401 [Closterium sp. NIES-68]|nr:hypothetical protein CLOM_g13401 [Closterium sp. NIES-68]
MAAPATAARSQQESDVDYLITNVLMPVDADQEGNPFNGYARFTVRMSQGAIASVVRTSPITPHAVTHAAADAAADAAAAGDANAVDDGAAAGAAAAGAADADAAVAERGRTVHVIDGTNKMLLPGMVNAHTHSIEAWGRGGIMPLPLELWVNSLFTHMDPRGPNPNASPDVVYWAALHTAIETIMTGGTAVMDHLYIRDLSDLEAAVRAYKQVGIRAFIAPMLGDLDVSNYFPLVPDACERNERAREEGLCPGAMGPDGFFREQLAERQEENTERVLSLWREAAQKFHDPAGGINIVIGPVQNWGASEELIRRAVEIRKDFSLCGHIHLLESRMQKLQSRSRYPDGGCVKLLKDIGWLSLPGTSCAHCVWLEDEEQAIMAECGAVAVHNPVSNLRLGSGIAPIRDYLDKGISVAIGCDGQCSNDSQDMLEAVKLACIVNPLTTPEYRRWLSPREVLKMATEGGAAALGMRGKAGAIRPGYVADAVLVDLTALSMLPRADPLGQLVLTRQSSGIAGNTVHSVWVNGRLLLSDGAPTTVDLPSLRQTLLKQQPQYMDPQITDAKGRPVEVEYRAAMGLDTPLGTHDQGHSSNYPIFRVNYPADIPYRDKK